MGFPIPNLQGFTYYKLCLSLCLIIGIHFQSYGQITLEKQAEELTHYLV